MAAGLVDDIPANETGRLAVDAVSFGIALSAPPAVNVLLDNAQPTAACPGSFIKPEAVRGNLCIYFGASGGAAGQFHIDDGQFASASNTANPFGFIAELFSNGTNSSPASMEFHATWAVTAP
jgi:hypothetical protein